MLRRFVYLDRVSLAQYVSALEGGQTTESTIRSLKGGMGKGGLDAKFANASKENSHENEESRSYSDTPEAQFDRLMKAATASPEALAWVDVTQPEVDFEGIGVGAMVSWECENYIPEIVQSMSGKGEMLGALNMMQNLLPAAQSLGLDIEGLPNRREIDATSTFITEMGSKLLVVGDDDDTEWRVAGKIEDEYLHGELDGRARIVGKVAKVLSSGHSKPFLTFPGMNLVSREKRRAMERQAPPAGQEDQYLTGPALMLDILAIYR